MSDADALIERLRRENRRWKALALAACAVAALMALGWYVSAVRGRQLAIAERMSVEAHRALAAAKAAVVPTAADGPAPQPTPTDPP